MPNLNSVGRARKAIAASDLLVMLGFVSVLTLAVLQIWSVPGAIYLGFAVAGTAMALLCSVVYTERANRLERQVSQPADSEYLIDAEALAAIEAFRVPFPKFVADYLEGIQKERSAGEPDFIQLWAPGIGPDLENDLKAAILECSAQKTDNTANKLYKLSAVGILQMREKTIKFPAKPLEQLKTLQQTKYASSALFLDSINGILGYRTTVWLGPALEQRARMYSWFDNEAEYHDPTCYVASQRGPLKPSGGHTPPSGKKKHTCYEEINP